MFVVQTNLVESFLFSASDSWPLVLTCWFFFLICRSHHFGHLTQDARSDIADLLECVTYLICQDGEVSAEHFARIINGR